LGTKAVEGEVVAKHAGGRPPKLTPEERAEVLQAFRLYIERTPDPTLVGFVAFDPVPIKYMVTRDNIKDWDEFSPLQKIAIEKQEAFLLQAGGTGRYNTTLAIFRLKQPQHGYTDKVDADITSGGDKIQPVLVKFISSGEDVGNTDTDRIQASV
jgi:hypothetical protein